MGHMGAIEVKGGSFDTLPLSAYDRNAIRTMYGYHTNSPHKPLACCPAATVNARDKSRIGTAKDRGDMSSRRQIVQGDSVQVLTQVDTQSFETRTYAKVTWRIVPFLMFCYLVAYLDRVNVGFAKLQMSSDLHFSDTVYGLGAGIFFIAYFLVEIPSNIILHRVGARLWMARIMITWGIISSGMAFVTTPTAFYVTRFLLGLAEAGFYPGVILYLSYWYPSHRRGKMFAAFAAAVPLSG